MVCQVLCGLFGNTHEIAHYGAGYNEGQKAREMALGSEDILSRRWLSSVQTQGFLLVVGLTPATMWLESCRIQGEGRLRRKAEAEGRIKEDEKGCWTGEPVTGVLPLCPWGTPSRNCPHVYCSQRAYLSSRRDLELGFYCYFPGTQLNAWFPPLKDTTTLLCGDSMILSHLYSTGHRAKLGPWGQSWCPLGPFISPGCGLDFCPILFHFSYLNKRPAWAISW